MFQEFPYTNFHQLNLDWIVKIAKDFLDQYTHIQEVIQTGLDDLAESRETGLEELNQKTLDGLADLQDKYDTLNGLLQAWYDTHSADIAGQLADAIADFNDAAETKSQALLNSWPADYSELVTEYNNLKKSTNILYDMFDYWEEENESQTEAGKLYNYTSNSFADVTYAKACKYTIPDNMVAIFVTTSLSAGNAGFPAIAYFDSSDNQLGYEYITSSDVTQIDLQDQLLNIPENTAWFYVNSRNANQTVKVIKTGYKTTKELVDDVAELINNESVYRQSNDSKMSNDPFTFQYEKINGKYIGSNGTMTDNPNYFVTKPIPVYPKQLFECRSNADSGSIAIYAIVTKDGTIQSVGPTGGSGADYIVRYFNNSKDTIYISVCSKTETNFYTKLFNVKYNINSIIDRTMFYKTDTTIVYTNIVPSTGLSGNYTLSTPIKLKKGQTIHMYGRVSTSIPAIIKTDEYGSTYTSKVTGNNLAHYSYTATDEIEYVMMQHKDDDPFILDIKTNWNINKDKEDDRHAVVTFIFDDGYSEDQRIVDIFNKNNLRCGFALISTIQTNERCNDYLKWQRDGYSILSHSNDDDYSINPWNDPDTPQTTLIAKLIESKQHLERSGFDIKGWVTPNSVMLEQFRPLLKRYYDFGYTVYNGNYDPDTSTILPYSTFVDSQYDMCRVDLRGHTLQELKDAVDLAINNKGFITFYSHSGQMTDADFEVLDNNIDSSGLLGYITEKINTYNIKCLAPNEAYEYYYSKRASDNLKKTEFTPSTGTPYESYGNCYYEKDGKTVHVHIGISELSSGSNIVYQLPAEIRPENTIVSVGYGSSIQTNHLALGRILSNGNIDVRPDDGYAILDFTYMV